MIFSRRNKSIMLSGIVSLAGFYVTGITPSIFETAHARTLKKQTFDNTYKLIKWENLLPEKNLKALQKGPSGLLMPDGSEGDTIASPIRNKIKKPRNAYQQALMSVKVVEKYNNKKIRLPGFIVPIDIEGEGVTKEFFFVPFFGACLHLPPPPPNQIIYAKFPKGHKVKDLYDPYYMEATLYTKQTKNDLASSAYMASVTNLTPYIESK